MTGELVSLADFRRGKPAGSRIAPCIDVDTPLTREERDQRLRRLVGISGWSSIPDPFDVGSLAERLSDAFLRNDLATIDREFARRSPPYAADLALAIYTRLPPHHRTAFHAHLHRIARP